MPHFENLDQYEAKNPQSGKTHIVPIAPHSLQAADYHPGDEGSEPPRKRKRIGEFRKMEFEPVSIRQMEKEFKAAGRKRRRSHSKRKRQSIWKSLTQFFKSLFGTGGGKPAPKHNRARTGDDSGKPRQNRQNQPRGEQKGHKHKKKHGNKHSAGKQRTQQGRPDQPRKRPSQHPEAGQPSEATADQPPRKRNRRNRRRQSPGQRGKPSSDNQQQG